MAIVYCDRDGNVMMVTGFTGDLDQPLVPPAGEAFSVGVEDDIGRKIQRAPKQWRFALDSTFDDRAKFRYIGGKSAPSTAILNRYRNAANALADRVAEKRTRVASENAEHQRQLDVASMLRKPTVINAPNQPHPYTYAPAPAPRARAGKSTKKTKKARGRKA